MLGFSALDMNYLALTLRLTPTNNLVNKARIVLLQLRIILVSKRFKLNGIMAAKEAHVTAALKRQGTQSFLIVESSLAVYLHQPLIGTQSGRAMRLWGFHFVPIEVSIARM
jgi:hypothetical protein